MQTDALDEAQLRAVELARLVRAMRASQQLYFRHRLTEDLKRCKPLEAEVDRLVREILTDNATRLPGF
jgi:hypothetical protein